MKLKLAILTGLIGTFIAHSAEAKGDYPNTSGDVLFELQSDVLENSDDKIAKNDEKNDTRLLIEPKFFLNLSEGFKINNHWQLRPVEDREYQTYTVNSSKYYGATFYGKEGWVERDLHDDYGLILEELELMYEKNDIRLGLGKFDPMFGTAFYKKKYHGVYGTELPAEYKLTEKIGGNIAAVFPSIQIELGVFFDDTTGMSNSAIKNRGRDKSSGGAGNTDRPESFSVAVEGVGLFGVKDLNYNLGFRRLKTEKEWESDEKGYLFGLEYVYDAGMDSMIIPFMEYAYFSNYDGIDGRDTSYATFSLTGIKGNWNVVLSDTLKREEEKNFSDVRDYLIQYSVGYKFENGLMIDFGRKHRKQSIKTDTRTSYTYETTGGKISYMLSF
jgi:hypothetical protein